MHDWLDIDLYVSEECLHLAVSTPVRPDGSQNPSMPVMFFVHGGAFYGGTQIRMGAERLGAWDDVVVVAINYRVVLSNHLDITLSTRFLCPPGGTTWFHVFGHRRSSGKHGDARPG